MRKISQPKNPQKILDFIPRQDNTYTIYCNNYGYSINGAFVGSSAEDLEQYCDITVIADVEIRDQYGYHLCRPSASCKQEGPKGPVVDILDILEVVAEKN